jgi:guanylate kinase
MRGKLVLLLGPSGSGKGTLLSYVRASHPDFIYPISWVTRAPRVGERDGSTANNGKTYHFTTTEEFLRAKDEGFFIEWDQHFNHYYGTPAKEVNTALAEGRVVFQELEMNGAQQLLTQVPRENLRIIFITAGSWEHLLKRIAGREAVAPDELEKRRLAYEKEMEFSKNADFVIINEDGKIAETQKKLDEIIEQIVKS